MREPKINPYFPGRENVSTSIMQKYHFMTLKENETDTEAVYIYVKPEYKIEIENGHPIKGELRNPKRAGIYTRMNPT